MCTRQSCPACTYISQRLASPNLISMFPQYLTSCFPLAFLEGQQSTSSPQGASLCLDLSVLSTRVASSSSTLSQSYWIYCNILFFFFFFFFFSTILYFSASSLVFPLLPSLLSGPHAQPNVTLPLLPVGLGAATPPHVSAMPNNFSSC